MPQPYAAVCRFGLSKILRLIENCVKRKESQFQYDIQVCILVGRRHAISTCCTSAERQGPARGRWPGLALASRHVWVRRKALQALKRLCGGGFFLGSRTLEMLCGEWAFLQKGPYPTPPKKLYFVPVCYRRINDLRPGRMRPGLRFLICQSIVNLAVISQGLLPLPKPVHLKLAGNSKPGGERGTNCLYFTSGRYCPLQGRLPFHVFRLRDCGGRRRFWE